MRHEPTCFATHKARCHEPGGEADPQHGMDARVPPPHLAAWTPRHGFHVPPLLAASPAGGLLGPQSQGLEFRQMVDLVQADGNRFEGKVHLVQQLRILDARVTGAWNERGPDAWEKANRALEPHVEHSFAVARRVPSCLFDLSQCEERERMAEGDSEG